MSETDRWQQELTGLVRQLRELVDSGRGDFEIWFAVGLAASCGWGAEKDSDVAESWFRRAADAGHVPAMMRLAAHLSRMIDESSRAESVHWYRRAADAGDTSGMIFLGFAFRDGGGIAISMESAADWFERAAVAGDTHAWVHAGRVYARHLNRPEEALRCFHEAAKAGDRESHLELALLHQDRRSPLYRPEEALRWYEKVAGREGGSRFRAMIALARFHRNGEGTPHDPGLARLWLLRVLDASSKESCWYREAAELLEAMESEMI